MLVVILCVASSRHEDQLILTFRIDDLLGVETNLPSNLLDDLTDESSALAQVALGTGHTGLDNTGSGFLYPAKK